MTSLYKGIGRARHVVATSCALDKRFITVKWKPYPGQVIAKSFGTKCESDSPDSQWTIDVEGGSCADDTGCSTSVLRERHISEWRTERATHYMDGEWACDTSRDRHTQTSERSRAAQAWQIIAACVSEGLWISWPKCTRHESAMYCEMNKLVYFVRGVNYM